jgi:hypothetical protein
VLLHNCWLKSNYGPVDKDRAFTGVQVRVVEGDERSKGCPELSSGTSSWGWGRRPKRIPSRELDSAGRSRRQGHPGCF